MTIVLLARSDFRECEGKNLIEGILSDLRIPENEWDEINFIELTVKKIEHYDEIDEKEG